MFYDRFEELCKKRGVSPSKAANEAGVNKSTVTYWKNNATAKPTGQIAERLCSYFGITMSELYGEEKEYRPMSLDEKLNGINFALYGEIEELSDEDKQDILDFIRFKKSQRKSKE